MKIRLKNYLKNNKLICDGAFGTYYNQIFDCEHLPELDNTKKPENVARIHREYIASGAMLIRTNTFAANTYSFGLDFDSVSKSICAACDIAKEVASDDIYIAGDIGPIIYDNLSHKDAVKQQYIDICKIFISKNVDAIVFETFSDIADILPAISYIKENSDIFVLVQFAVNQFGYSSLGFSYKKLFDEACKNENIDCVGFNCGIGPTHMLKLINHLICPSDKYISAFPNAGYPQTVSNRTMYVSDNTHYFTEKIKAISDKGVSILGGCCGSTPDFIKRIASQIDLAHTFSAEAVSNTANCSSDITDNSFYKLKRGTSDKIVAVELAPPFGNDDEKLMDAAHLLQRIGVDVLTFPDSPSGRTRADSILIAAKVARETDLHVMPHLCCRDKNAIAIRSSLLGAQLNDINNFLVITGDPVPSIMRQSIKSVFNFDSVGFMNIIKGMNEDLFSSSPLIYGGAINQNRKNIDVEIKRVKKKMEAGASFFLTQPAFSTESIERIRRIKEETNAMILCGIMPLVSKKNACFMQNEMAGIDVPDEIISRYDEAMTKTEGEAVGIKIAKEIMKLADFCEGYYFSFPFNRVHMLEDILPS